MGSLARLHFSRSVSFAVWLAWLLHDTKRSEMILTVVSDIDRSGEWGVYVPCENPDEARALARVLANDIGGRVHVLHIHGENDAP